MKNLVLKQNYEIERKINTGDYQDFKGLKFKIIDNLPPGQYVEFTTHEPTYIKQSTGAIKVTAKAPTIIEGCTGKIIIDSYAPMLIRGSTGEMKAYLRENTSMEGNTGDINIRAAPYLELIANEVSHFNGKYNRWGPVHLNAPEGNRGFILFKGSSGHLNFEYDTQAKLYLSKDTNSNRLVQIVRKLLE